MCTLIFKCNFKLIVVGNRSDWNLFANSAFFKGDLFKVWFYDPQYKIRNIDMLNNVILFVKLFELHRYWWIRTNVLELNPMFPSRSERSIMICNQSRTEMEEFDIQRSAKSAWLIHFNFIYFMFWFVVTLGIKTMPSSIAMPLVGILQFSDSIVCLPRSAEMTIWKKSVNEQTLSIWK